MIGLARHDDGVADLGQGQQAAHRRETDFFGIFLQLVLMGRKGVDILFVNGAGIDKTSGQCLSHVAHTDKANFFHSVTLLLNSSCIS